MSWKTISSKPQINFILGDITHQNVDAIVNAANSSLLGGGGVDGAIHRAGGPAILDACKELRRTTHPDGLPTGQAVATIGGKLPAKYVIHAVGPIYNKDVDQSHLLRDAHINSLRVADELGIQSMALPAISTGIYSYPIEDAAKVALKAITSTPTKVRQINFVFLDKDTKNIYESAFKGLNK